MVAHSLSQQQKRASSEFPCLGMEIWEDGRMCAKEGAVSEETQRARWIGWSSSSSWSSELGTVCALMNNGEEARKGGGEKRRWRGEEEEAGVRQ